jgi:serine/threonine protein kinase/tetratricopeptide (TPR) repeat protein
MIGRTLGKYKIIEFLGRGGMAEVYKAYHANLDRYVALKLIKTTIADDPEYLTRFEREAKSAAALRHSNIVQVYDYEVDTESGRPYIVMELVKGDTLANELDQRAKNGTPLTLADTAHIVGEVAAALAYAHEHGVVHRDVKPGNIILDASGHLILTDFGLAKITGGPSVTASGVGMGTPDYMAPEQIMGRPVDGRTDLYALGVILYRLLTGQLPYHAETPMAAAIKHVTDPIPDPRAIKPDLPESLAYFVMKSMRKLPDERFQTAESFLAEFQAALTQADPFFVQHPLPVAATTVITPILSPLAPTTSRTLPIAGSMSTAYPATLKSPPPEPSLPAKVVDFVGREAELAYFTDKLMTGHLAVILGMPGVGKTGLASELARRQDRPTRTFWHSFHEGEGVNALIWKLAGFLAWHDQGDLWNTLQSCTQTGSQAPPPELLLDYLFHMLRGQGYLLFFDDFHHVDDDPLLNQFIERLQPTLKAGEIDVIIAAQRRPAFVHEDDFALLDGLTLADLRRLVLIRGLDLSDELIETLLAYTEGNAQLVMLALDALRRTKEPARLMSRLSESDQVEHFLVKEVDQGLTDEERNVLSAVAILLGYPTTRDAIAAVLDGASVRRPLNDLTSRSLLTVKEKDYGKEYTLNTMVRSFYYDLLSQQKRQAMHRRAGEFYESQAADALSALRAARHFQECGEYARALRLVTTDVWAIINQGQARTLRHVLDQFSEQQLDKPEWATVLWARGQVYALLGEAQIARTSYEAAFAQAQTLSDTNELQARCCRGLGELLQDDAPQEALDWLRRGLETVQGIESVEKTALHIRIGRLLDYLGHHDQALVELQQGLKRLPPGPSRLHIAALGNLGNIYCTRGDTERGSAYYQEVLKTAQKLGDYWAMVEVSLNLGIELDIAGHWTEAMTQFRQALEQAEQLGSLRQQARALLSVGTTSIKQGDYESAKSNLSKCISIARSRNWKSLIIYANNSLVDICVYRSELEVAETRLSEAEQLAQATGVRDPLPETYRHWTLVRLAQGRPQEALAYAERSVSLAYELDSTADQGIGLRVHGLAQWANHQRGVALDSFEKSLATLADRDPYESARTQVEWAKCLRSEGNVERSTTLLQQAKSAFEKLGAQRDLADVDGLLASPAQVQG